MRRHALGLALLTASLMTPAWADDKPVAEDETLYGTWVLTSLEDMGKAVPNFEGGGTFVFSKGGKVTMKEKGRPDQEGAFKVAATKSPREIDLIGPKEEGQVQETMKGIYQIEGDTLKLVFSSRKPEGERPTSFEKAKLVLTFKRQKP
jgi:uncharacterized protein (TIGR03067 family)